MHDVAILPSQLDPPTGQIPVKFQTIQSLQPSLAWPSHDGFVGLGPNTDDKHPSFLKD